jgi:hypothetical protein
VVHLQKAAPKHWFGPGEMIKVENCPTRFGHVSWTTEAASGAGSGATWRVTARFTAPFEADLIIHIHPPDRRLLRSASLGEVRADRVLLPTSPLAGKMTVIIEID